MIDIISQKKIEEEEKKDFTRFIGRGLLVIRYQKNLSIKQVAQMSGYSEELIEKIEAGTSIFNLDYICHLLSVYKERYYKLL
jgi:transcriptional regulator with XRE-family HTH domain